MRRTLVVIVMLVAAATTAVVLVLWARSHLVLDSILWRMGSRAGWQANCEVHSAHGILNWGSQSHAFEGPCPPGVVHEQHSHWPEGWYREKPSTWDGVVGTSWLNRRGFHFEWGRRTSPAGFGRTSVSTTLRLGVPHWVVMIVAASPWVWLARARRRRRRRGFGVLTDASRHRSVGVVGGPAAG